MPIEIFCPGKKLLIETVTELVNDLTTLEFSVTKGPKGFKISGRRLGKSID
jgi:hypothetical protein